MPPETPATHLQPPLGRRPWRALLIAVLLLPFTAYWSVEILSDIIFSLLVPPVCALMVLAAANVGLRRWIPRFALAGWELALIYVFLSVANAMCAEWTYVNAMYIPTYALLADRNAWDKEHVLPHLPAWFYLTDPAELEDYRRGGYGLAHFLTRLTVWAKPIAGWTALFGLMCGAMLCINALMREQWTRREKLSFPIIQVPLLLTKPESPAWRSGFLWAGFGVIFAIDMLNGFAFLYPALPTVNVRFLAGRLVDVIPSMSNAPWVSLGWTSVGLFPYMAAIGLFMPTDLLFSCVFFFFARKALQFGMEMYGYEQGVFGGGWLVPAAPYFSEQTWGAVFALFVGAIASSRGYLRELWRHILRNTGFDDSEVKPRGSLVGLIACLGGLGALGYAVGLPPGLVVGYVGVFLVFSVVLTRMRAQVGPPIHEMAFLGPHQVLLGIAGFKALPEAATVKLYHLFFVANRIHRSHPMPYQLEAFKIGQTSGIPARTIFWTIVAAFVLGTAFGNGAYALRGYIHGAQPGWGEPGAAARTIAEQPQSGGPAAPLAMLAGFGIVLLLDAVRFQTPGFPLHPVGYALSMNYGIDYCWFGLMVVLIVKLAVQRYYGLRGYERLRLVAIGVILGEFAAELIWSTYSMLTQSVAYSISFYNRAGWLK